MERPLQTNEVLHPLLRLRQGLQRAQSRAPGCLTEQANLVVLDIVEVRAAMAEVRPQGVRAIQGKILTLIYFDTFVSLYSNTT